MNQQHSADRSRRAQAGFTLVEIMVVIVILGMLATLVATNVMSASDEARTTKALADCKTIASGVRSFWTKNGTLPESLEVLWTKDEKGRSELDEVGDDPWGNPYELVPGDRPSDFEVISYGPDKSQGTEDDISSKTKKDN